MTDTTAHAVLWCIPGAASLAVHLVLEETGTPYELRMLDLDGADAPRPAELIALNPDGRVPVLELDGLTLTESAAICLHLADRSSGEPSLAPAIGTPERAQLYRRLVFLTNTVQETLLRFLYPHRYVDDVAASDAVARRAALRLHELFDRIDADLTGPYVLGDSLSVADYYLFMLTRWGRHLDPPAWNRARLRAHWLRIAERPAVARTLEQERLGESPAGG